MRYFWFLLIVTISACDVAREPDDFEPAESAADQVCEVVQPAASLPPALDESSGVAAGRGGAGVLWTHNDSGSPAELFSVTPAGELIARVTLQNANNVDWEDIAVGPCPEGECLYIADIGDNRGDRDYVSVYRLPVPAGGGDARVEQRFDMRYPGGPRDAEGLFVMPTGELYIVTKGGGDARAELFRYPGELRTGEPAELELVTPLTSAPLELLDRLSAADASPSGEWIGLRSYQSVAFHRPDDLFAGDTVPAARFELDDVEEVQGEGLALLDDGTVYLTGEAGFDEARGTISVLRCRLP